MSTSHIRETYGGPIDEEITVEPPTEWHEPGSWGHGLARLGWRRVAAVAAFVVGFVLIVAGWWQIGGTRDVASQLPYLMSGGIGGLFCVALGGFLLYSGDVRQVQVDLRALQSRLDALEGGLVAEFDSLHGRFDASLSQARAGINQ